ncbi:hypothetical protein ACR78H_08230 [Sphingobacterium siyangense]|uniref:hypothetical protein n=1 Tax=Sphingobacterium siyangense TaxID=459529 RepID=UPI003DA5BC80
MSLKQTFYKVRSSKIVQGILIANIFAFLIIGMQSSLLPKDVGVLVFSEFVIIPMLMGIIMAWCWKVLLSQAPLLEGQCLKRAIKN